VKARGNCTLGKPRRILVFNIKINLREIGYKNERWIELAQDRVQRRPLVLVVFNIRFLLPKNSLAN
jgi:hypothetical protein